MCGLIGAFARNGAEIEEGRIRNGLARMVRRGPDGEGIWRDSGVLLGHRRLAIIDLNPCAGQPMRSADARYTIVFNGEIYNHRDLRHELEARGVVFRTASDTEVVLALFADRGPEMLPRLEGMFAFVIWDRLSRRAFAARDPYGIKPLYYAETLRGALVASQVRALLATGLVSRESDPHGQAAFWLLGSVPEPRTWFRGIQAIPAGHYAWIEEGRVGTSTCWQDIGDAWRSAEPTAIPDVVIREHVRAALRESVRRHLVADVPIGVFLSGGIDSGALAGLMVDTGARNVNGVTISYDEYTGSGKDEVPVAAIVAAQYGIKHHVYTVTRQDFVDDQSRILDAMDQPSIDGVNTWYAAKAAAELGLKVVVSGVGGDELFQGYVGFTELPRLVAGRKAFGALPGSETAMRLWVRWKAARTGNRRWRHLPEWSRTLAGAWWLRRSFCAPEDLAIEMGEDAAREALRAFDVERSVEGMSGGLPRDERMALSQIESTTYLRNQLLRDGDWASMDHSVELRTPLVDAKLLKALSPMLGSFSRYPGKILLATAPSNPLPQRIVGRPKTGFGIPIATWLRGEGVARRHSGLRAWARVLVGKYVESTG